MRFEGKTCSSSSRLLTQLSGRSCSIHQTLHKIEDNNFFCLLICLISLLRLLIIFPVLSLLFLLNVCFLPLFQPDDFLKTLSPLGDTCSEGSLATGSLSCRCKHNGDMLLFAQSLTNSLAEPGATRQRNQQNLTLAAALAAGGIHNNRLNL